MDNGKPSIIQIDITDMATSFNVSKQRVINLIKPLLYIYGSRGVFVLRQKGHWGFKIIGYAEPIRKLSILLTSIASNDLISDKDNSYFVRHLTFLLENKIKVLHMVHTFGWWHTLNNSILKHTKLSPRFSKIKHKDRIKQYESIIFKPNKLMSKANYGK